MNRKLKRTVLTAAILAVCLSACASPLREETQENGEAQTMDETQMAEYTEGISYQTVLPGNLIRGRTGVVS